MPDGLALNFDHEIVLESRCGVGRPRRRRAARLRLQQALLAAHRVVRGDPVLGAIAKRVRDSVDLNHRIHVASRIADMQVALADQMVLGRALRAVMPLSVPPVNAGQEPPFFDGEDAALGLDAHAAAVRVNSC